MSQIPKGYKQTDVGVIPEEWEVAKIIEICSITTGNKNTQDKIDNGKYPFFVRSQNVEKINSYSFDGEAVLTAGDGVGTGKVFHYVNGKFDFHQRVYKMSDFKNDIYGFYFYKYFSTKFYERIMSMTAKSSVDSVRRDMIANMLIPLPPKSEQEAIAGVLSDSDALISALGRLIDKKQNLKLAAMQHLLTPKDDWEVKTYDEVFDFLTTASYSRAELSDNGSVQYVHYGDIHTRHNFFLDFSKNELPTIDNEQSKNYPLLKDGDLIMADASEDYQGIGKSVEVQNLKGLKAISGLHTFLLRDKNQTLVDGFRAYLHISSSIKAQFDRLATGLKVFGISKNNLKMVQIPIPPKTEQTRIAAILSDMDEEIGALESKLSKQRLIKQALMSELLTGRIRLV